MKRLPGLQDVNTDQQNGGLEELMTYDRVTAARLGQTAQSLDQEIYSSFGQSQTSTTSDIPLGCQESSNVFRR